MKCESCKYEMCDYSVGYFECMKVDDFTDEEYAEYEEKGELENCPYFQEETE